MPLMLPRFRVPVPLLPMKPPLDVEVLPTILVGLVTRLVYSGVPKAVLVLLLVPLLVERPPARGLA